MNKKFISIDPSLRNTAVVWGDIVDGKIVPIDWGISQTSPDKSLPKADDLIRRCHLTLLFLGEIYNKVKPDYVFVEKPSGSQNYHAAVSYGVSCAFIATFFDSVVLSTPTEVKVATGLSKTAQKEEIMEWAKLNYEGFPFPLKKGGSFNKSKAEHICDAIAVAESGLNKV